MTVGEYNLRAFYVLLKTYRIIADCIDYRCLAVAFTL